MVFELVTMILNDLEEIQKFYNNKDSNTYILKVDDKWIEVDKEKFKKWLIFCSRLENIDQSTSIDMAIKKKFAEKDEKIETLKQALFDMASQLLKM